MALQSYGKRRLNVIRIVIAEHDDKDAEKLCQEGAKRGLDVRWFQLGLDSAQYSVLWERGKLPTLWFQNVEVSTETVSRASWVFHREMRLKKKPYVQALVGTQQEDEFCMREWSSLLASAILAYKFSIHANKWVSSFCRADFTDRKLFMLSHANGLGVDVPNFAAATTFRSPSCTSAVVKAINADEMIDDRTFPTTVLADDQVEAYEGQRSECPSLVQQKIFAVRELRVFYVKGRWLCLELEMVDQQAPVDIRYSTNPSVALIDTLPAALKEGLQKLCKTLEMSYCVFDILVDQSGHHWLIDVTPNGTWSWYENISGINVTREILNALEVDDDKGAP